MANFTDMANTTGHAISNMRASISALYGKQRAAYELASAKEHEMRAHLAQAEAFEALAQDATATASELCGIAGVQPNVRDNNVFTGQSGSALGVSVGTVQGVHAVVDGAWTGAASDAFRASVSAIEKDIEEPARAIRSFFTSSASNCHELAGQAQAKATEQRVLAATASRAMSQARSRAEKFTGSIRSANQQLAALQQETAS